jgi:hypothetical protein
MGPSRPAEPRSSQGAPPSGRRPIWRGRLDKSQMRAAGGSKRARKTCAPFACPIRRPSNVPIRDRRRRRPVGSVRLVAASWRSGLAAARGGPHERHVASFGRDLPVKRAEPHTQRQCTATGRRVQVEAGARSAAHLSSNACQRSLFLGGRRHRRRRWRRRLAKQNSPSADVDDRFAAGGCYRARPRFGHGGRGGPGPLGPADLPHRGPGQLSSNGRPRLQLMQRPHVARRCCAMFIYTREIRVRAAGHTRRRPTPSLARAREGRRQMEPPAAAAHRKHKGDWQAGRRRCALGRRWSAVRPPARPALQAADLTGRPGLASIALTAAAGRLRHCAGGRAGCLAGWLAGWLASERPGEELSRSEVRPLAFPSRRLLLQLLPSRCCRQCSRCPLRGPKFSHLMSPGSVRVCDSRV